MTDDELHQLWIEGCSTTALAIRARTTVGSICGRLRRLRRREGEDRWPKRFFIKPKDPAKPRPPERLKPGASTLPPLRSLGQ